LEKGWKIYFFKRSNFAANQLVSNMEIITFESKAYKELDNKITAIVDYIFNHMEAESTNEDEIWVDSYEVCTFLKISEVKRMLEERLIRSNKENIQDLITNHQLHVKERRNLRKNK
jgi:GTPase involved in cell partitioning and DNA repair